MNHILFCEGGFIKNWDKRAEQIMVERFGRDTVISLATVKNETPYVRQMNAYYVGAYQDWLNEKQCGGSILPSRLLHGCMNMLTAVLSL